jgi:hypothetical protein
MPRKRQTLNALIASPTVPSVLLDQRERHDTSLNGGSCCMLMSYQRPGRPNRYVEGLQKRLREMEELINNVSEHRIHVSAWRSSLSMTALPRHKHSSRA